MRKPTLKSAIYLKGVRYSSTYSQNKVWLDNKYLNPGKSLKVKTHSNAGFNWGDDEKGAAQLALAICLELYPLEVAKEIYLDFNSEFIQSLKGDTLEVTLNIAAFNDSYAEPWLVPV